MPFSDTPAISAVVNAAVRDTDALLARARQTLEPKAIADLTLAAKNTAAIAASLEQALSARERGRR